MTSEDDDVTTATRRPDAAAFLRSIAADPDNDTPRLAFADFLQEHGEGERAEFVRVQCELATVANSCDPDCPRRNQKSDRCGSYFDVKTNKPVPCCDCWRELRARESALLAANRRTWLAGGVCEACQGWGNPYRADLNLELPRDRAKYGCPECHGSGDTGGLLREGVQVEWRRGFPARVTVPAVGWLVEWFCPKCGHPESHVAGNCNGVTSCPPSAWLRSVLDAGPERGLIAEVVPTCRVPATFDFAGRSVSCFDDWGDFGDYPHYIPTPILSELVGEQLQGPGQKANPTPAEAIAALGRAFVKWALTPIARP